MKVKALDQITAKWSTRAAAAGQAYQAGVQNPKNPWASSTAAAASNWATGVQNAVSNGTFAKGVQTAGDAKWQAGATTKGVTRYPQGVQAPTATTNFSNGFGKYQQVLTSLQLPARLPKGDPGNMQRVQAVVTALRNAKMGK